MQKQIIDFIRKNYILLAIGLIIVMVIINVLLNATLTPSTFVTTSQAIDEPFGEAPTTTVNDSGEAGATNVLPREDSDQYALLPNTLFSALPETTSEFEAFLLPLTDEEPARITVYIRQEGGKESFLEYANSLGGIPSGTIVYYEDSGDLTEEMIESHGDYYEFPE